MSAAFEAAQRIVFNALYAAQKGRFYNALYKLQAVLSSLFVLSVVFTHEYNWSEEMADGLRIAFSIPQVPVYALGERAQYICFGIATAWLLALLLIPIGLNFSSSNWSNSPRIAQGYRALLGVALTFYITFMRSWLAWVDCDYFGDYGPGGATGSQNNQIRTSDDQHLSCFDSSLTVGLGVAGFIFALLWFAVVATASLAHDNNPTSWNIAARPNSWCDQLNIMTAYPLIFATIILNGRIGVVPAAPQDHSFQFCCVRHNFCVHNVDPFVRRARGAARDGWAR